MVRRGLDIARRHEPDLIIATSPPEVVLAVARSIASRTGTPWVADYRDLWFHDMLLYRSKAMSSLLGPVNRWLTRDASALVTVSRGLQQRLESYAKRDVLVCYNGFLEADQHAPVVSQFRDGRLHIVYTGRLYPEKRDPAPLFAALAELRTTMPELASRIAVDFYGFDDPWLRSLISSYQAQDFVTLHGFVPYQESVVAQRAADVLLFLDWTDAGAKGVLTGKLFEYLASGRPVLSLGSTKHSEAAELIAEAQCGVALTRSGEVTEYLRALLASGATRPRGSSSIHQFSREAQARTLLKTLSARLFREKAPL
jgi:glycosyltransferase involved in cell wall biosynthesis